MRRPMARVLSMAGVIVLVSVVLVACGQTVDSSSTALVPTGYVTAAGQQTIAGFGASGAWWPHDLYQWSAANQKKAEELLFGPKGLELSVYRYNIGGGGEGVHPAGGKTAPPSFLVSPGVYDWNDDPAGLTFLRAAVEMHVPVIIGFVNSAPPEFKTVPEACGGDLASNEVEAYTVYLATIAQHLHSIGLTLDYISPMNEPDYTFSTCGQEGMAVPPPERATVVSDLYAQLQQKAPYTKIIADESSQVGPQLLKEYMQWLPQVYKDIAAIAHHTYDFPSAATLEQMAADMAQFHKPTWMTEICCWDGTGYGQQYNPTISGAMWMADDIYKDMVDGHDASFQWWLAFSDAMGCSPLGDPSCATEINSSGWNDGLAYYDPNFASDGNQQIYLTKRFWVMANFSRYVRPGAVLHKVSSAAINLRLMAFSDSSGWVVIAINDNSTGFAATTVQVSIPTKDHLDLTGAYQTSATDNLQPVTGSKVHGDLLTITVPPQSVTTFVLANR